MQLLSAISFSKLVNGSHIMLDFYHLCKYLKMTLSTSQIEKELEKNQICIQYDLYT